MNGRTALASLAVLALVACDASDGVLDPGIVDQGANEAHVADAAPTRTYEITVENLTASGQPFTPPLITLHRRGADLFTVGKAAGVGIREIAENGNLAPMLGRLGDSRHVSSFTVAATPPVPPLEPGESVTVSLEAEPGARFVSFVSMLICTNDGFTGLDAAHLPNQVGDESVWYTDAYDAGTEVNTEDFADIVPPCPALSGVPSGVPGSGTSDPALAEGGVIHPHPGIAGIADLQPGVHGWTDPVARVTVRRTG